MRGWAWRTRYGACGGMGAGLGEGNEGVECGHSHHHQSACLAARPVEHEIECDPSDMAAMEADMAQAELSGHHWEGSSYTIQETIGIGGAVKKKVKKAIHVGAVVKEYEDERVTGKFLLREQSDANRAWCSWCERVELEYLCDSAVISPQTLSEILTTIPAQTALHAPISVGAVPTTTPGVGAGQMPTSPMSNFNNSNNNGFYNEKNDSAYFQSQNTTPQPPPSYNSPPPAANWPPLATATALYAYTSTDAGDLELQPNDQISVTEYMNAEWWKGRSERTGREGIFPRSYVKVKEEKEAAANKTNNYGNAPLEESGVGNGEGKVPNKGQEMGKKFGKKLGNAAVFGAGATLGSNLVNSIF
nr:protein csh3 [Quercus suber]